jgi:site-specific DNA recombinase
MTMTSNPLTTPPTRGTKRRPRRIMAQEEHADLGPVLVGVYIRVSTAREEMISPELQQRDVDAYLNRMKAETGRTWRTVVVVEDLDVSGRSFAREGIQRLMTLFRDGGITKIVTYRYDRFGRNLEQALTHLKEVEALGGQVVSVTEPFDATTAIGHFMRSQTLAMAELQSRQIGEGWKRVHQYRIAQGLPTSGRERYGYLAHRTTQQRSDGTLRICRQGCAAGECSTGFVPDAETAPVLQRIYHSYIAGKGFQAIAHELNEDGIPTPGVVAALRSGNPTRIARTASTLWGAGAVIDVADSGFAAGLVLHHDRWYPGAHEPLITPEMWSSYQQRRESQRLVPTKARSPRWALAGIAICGRCGGKMYCTSSPRGVQYALYCGTARVSGICSGVYRTREAVESAVGLWLESNLRVLKVDSRIVLRGEKPVPTIDLYKAERRKLAKVLESADGKVGRLLDAYTDGALDLSEYKRRRDDVQEAAQQAEARLAQLDAPAPTAPSLEQLAELASTWSGLSHEARRDAAPALLESVRVHADKTVEIRPRWEEPVLVTFTKRNTVPVLPQKK